MVDPIKESHKIVKGIKANRIASDIEKADQEKKKGSLEARDVT